MRNGPSGAVYLSPQVRRAIRTMPTSAAKPGSGRSPTSWYSQHHSLPSPGSTPENAIHAASEIPGQVVTYAITGMHCGLHHLTPEGDGIPPEPLQPRLGEK